MSFQWIDTIEQILKNAPCDWLMNHMLTYDYET